MQRQTTNLPGRRQKMEIIQRFHHERHIPLRQKGVPPGCTADMTPPWNSHEDTSRGRDADGIEELRMPEGQLDQLPDLCELSLAPADVIIPDFIQALVLVTLEKVEDKNGTK